MEHTWIELDLSVLADNLAGIRRSLRPGSEIIFVVKANAYGHGMIPVCRCAVESGVKWFAVAHMDEATCLTDKFPGVCVMVLGVLRRSAVPEAVARGIIPVVVSEEHGRELGAEAVSRSQVLKCHVKVDTGMGRLGFFWDGAASAIEKLSRTQGLELTGICTHLASADDPGGSYSRTQAERFLSVVEDLRRRGISLQMRHISNSGGFRNLPECDYEGVRCGIEVYGYGGRGGGARAVTRPFLQWKSRIVQARQVPAGFLVGYGSTHAASRETVIATVDVGYSDGYCRLLGNKAMVLAGGRRVRVVGRVSMNLTTIDLGPGASEGHGDEVVLVGTQGNESIWADEVAGWCGTIPYEVLTNIRTDVRRLINKDVNPARQHAPAD